MKTFYLILFISLLLLFSSCNEGEVVTQTTSTEKAFLLNKKPTDPPDSIGTRALDCGYYRETTYQLLGFKPVSGKYIGISPRDNRYLTPGRISELRTKYGFTYANTWGGRVNDLLNAGFLLDKIMIGVNPNSYANMINTYGAGVYAYYLDEPDKNNYSNTINVEIRSYLIQKGFTNTKLGTGDFKGNRNFIITTTGCDFVMFTAYRKWWELAFDIWVSCCPINPDQRGSWTTWRNIWGNRFNQVWVGAHEDMSGYGYLLGHAANQGLNVVWLYQDQDATDDYSSTNITTFCDAAWTAGYLRKVLQEVQSLYHCTVHSPSPCVCSPDNGSCRWELVNVRYGNIIVL